MATNKTLPATPLPWHLVGDQTSGQIVKAGNGIASHIAKYHDAWVCEEHGNADGTGAFRNAAYIAHAANAYPRLVTEAAVLRCLATSPRFRSMTVAEALSEMGRNGMGHNPDLLRELGEDA